MQLCQKTAIIALIKIFPIVFMEGQGVHIVYDLIQDPEVDLIILLHPSIKKNPK